MIERLNRGSKLVIAMFTDAVVAAMMLWLSYWFLEQVFNTGAAQKLWWLLPVSSVITVGSFYFLGLYRTILRFAGPRFFVQVIISSIIVSGLIASIALASVYGERVGFPRRVFVLFAITLSVGSACTRLFARWYFERRSNRNRIPAVIYGAGSGGHQLFSALRYGGHFAPVAFIDDDPIQQGRSIHGLRVFPLEKLKSLIQTKKAHTVLLAMPALSHEHRAKIIARLQRFNIVIKTTPSLSEIISGKANLSDLHGLSIEDLMTRPTVLANEDLAGKCVEEKTVLVTGAGGSIGSELCRQIVMRKPQKIVLYEMSESSLFYLEQELLDRTGKLDPTIEIVSVLGSVLNTNLLKETILHHDVKTVFHAAAYKHVPMLEANPIEGVRNNVIGTRRVAEACAWAGVCSLVVVSTDKAVRPTNLMGATKRFAELIVQAIASTNTTMNTCVVRFGNVLGSSGSVVPTFQEQIKYGGPVTVTHPEMTRFFMTIPEASQLVLQAGSMAAKAEVFVLDMGDPVRINDLAKRMIELSGFQVLDAEHPNGDIEITYTGLRPGEKMYEELSIEGTLESTQHPKISRSVEKQQPAYETLELATLLELAIENYEQDEVLRLLCLAVPEYTPSLGLHRCPEPTVTTQKTATLGVQRGFIPTTLD